MEQQITSSIDREISHYMVDQKITGEQMAEILGMTANTLRAKRTGKSDWTWREILKLCDLLDTSPNELAGM